MTARLRVVDTGLASGRWNTALSAALMRSGSERLDGACLRFYRFERCVLLGASQPYETGADIRACTQAGIQIARRVTGGGSVYMSPSMLAFDVVKRASAPVETMSREIAEALAEALRGLGIEDVAASATGLTLGGRKISGAAMSSDRGSFLYQGTLLIEDETPAMAAALGIDAAALGPFVTSLRAACSQVPEPMKFMTAFAAALARREGLVTEIWKLTAEVEAIAAREHAREIGTEAFVRGADMENARSARA